jgi:hypothetical protein
MSARCNDSGALPPIEEFKELSTFAEKLLMFEVKKVK